MKNKITLLTLVLISLTFLSICSCKKDKVKGCTDPISLNYNPEAEENDGSCEYAGLGGNATIVAFPQHHGKDTRPYHAYVKFNTQEFPGTDTTLYDLNVEADTTENHVEIESLKKGKYYIYMVAYDTSISAVVSGGIPVTVNITQGETDIIVPVTE